MMLSPLPQTSLDSSENVRSCANQIPNRLRYDERSIIACLTPSAGVTAPYQKVPRDLPNQGLACAGVPAAKGSPAMPVICPGLMSSGMPRAASICCLRPAPQQ